MADFNDWPITERDPATKGAAVSPSDDNDLPTVSRGLFIGTAGDVKVTFAGQTDDDAVILKNIANGTHFPYAVKKVFDTGTDATDIVALN